MDEKNKRNQRWVSKIEERELSHSTKISNMNNSFRRFTSNSIHLNINVDNSAKV